MGDDPDFEVDSALLEAAIAIAPPRFNSEVTDKEVGRVDCFGLIIFELFLDLSTQSPTTSSCKYNGLERLSAEALLAGIDNKFLDSNNSVRNLCFLRIRSVELLVL